MGATQLVVILRPGHWPIVIEIIDGGQEDAIAEAERRRVEMPDALVFCSSAYSTWLPANVPKTDADRARWGITSPAKADGLR